MGPAAENLHGAVVLACNDDALELLLDHREALAERYVLDVCDVAAQRAMLDKLATYRLAAEAGVPTPRFWPARTAEEVLEHADEYAWPLMMKPLLAHRFKKVIKGKYLMVGDVDELMGAYRLVSEHEVEVVLLEVIPGPDDLLCSYYTYIDDQGAPQFHFTKRVIRRYPEREGFGCYHITDWNPEVREPASGSSGTPGSRASPTSSSRETRATAGSSSSSATPASRRRTDCSPPAASTSAPMSTGAWPGCLSPRSSTGPTRRTCGSGIRSMISWRSSTFGARDDSISCRGPGEWHTVRCCRTSPGRTPCRRPSVSGTT